MNELFRVIALDERHTRLVKLIREPINQRQFSSWSMGYAALTPKELESIDGMNDFFHGGSCLADIDSGKAQRVLNSFADGKWRIG